MNMNLENSDTKTPFKQHDLNTYGDQQNDDMPGVSKFSRGIDKDGKKHKMSSFLAQRRKGLGKSGKLTKGNYINR